MDIQKYEVFLHAVDYGSMTMAAEELGYTQSGVSHIIRGLEDEMGFPMLLRHRTGVSPTQEAERLIPIMRDLVKWSGQLDQMAAQVRGVELGNIRIGSLTSISREWLPQIFGKFQADHPNISIKVLEGGDNEITEWLEAGRVDVGLYGFSGSNAFDWIALQDDSYLAVVPKDHPMAEMEAFPIRAFDGVPFVTASENSHREIHRLLSKYNVKPDYRYFSTDDHAIISMISQGLGVAIQSALILKAFSHGNVRVMELEPRCFRTLGIVVPTLKNASPAVKTFIVYLRRIVGGQSGKAS